MILQLSKNLPILQWTRKKLGHTSKFYQTQRKLFSTTKSMAAKNNSWNKTCNHKYKDSQVPKTLVPDSEKHVEGASMIAIDSHIFMLWVSNLSMITDNLLHISGKCHDILNNVHFQVQGDKEKVEKIVFNNHPKYFIEVFKIALRSHYIMHQNLHYGSFRNFLKFLTTFASF